MIRGNSINSRMMEISSISNVKTQFRDVRALEVRCMPTIRKPIKAPMMVAHAFKANRIRGAEIRCTWVVARGASFNKS